MLDAAWAGALAGYAIAVPIGPIAVLIFDLGVRRGFAAAAPAAAGAASADGIYATLAGLFGAAVASLVAPLLAPMRLLGAAVLVAIGLRGLLAVRAAGVPTGARADGGGCAGPRTYLAFLGLTLANPMTLVYFAALMLGLPALGEGLAERLGFAAAAFAASLSWQLLLAGGAALLHGRLSPGVQRLTRIAGALVILAFAVRIAVEALSSA